MAEEEKLPALLARTEKGLRMRIFFQVERDPESVFEAFSDLNLVMELKERLSG